MNEAEQVQPENPYSGADLRKEGQKWLDKIRAAERRDENWQKDAQAASKAFLGDDASTDEGKCYDFNILHSNIETIAPAVYNSTPIPDIRERFRSGDSDPQSAVSREVAQVIERAIMVQIDDGALDSEMEFVVQDALVAGRGIIRMRFDADEQEVPGQPVIGPSGFEEVDAVTGETVMTPPQVQVVNERLRFEVVSWRDYREGPARRWEDVPWVAYRHCIPWEEVQKMQDPQIKEALAAGGTDGTAEENTDADADTYLWEVWCKDSRTVKMIVEHSGEILSIVDDPMGLPNFFCQAKPLQPVTASGRRTPVVPFAIYKKLADELDMISRRIMAITTGLKVRGLYVGAAEDIEKLSLAGDNELIPVSNLEGLAQTGNLSNAIMWWPLDQAITVLRELYVSREATKNMIYEITGISDIVRGQGAASETATAQEIKSQWGSIRIRKLQRMVERAVREIFVLCAEVIATKFSPKTLQDMTGIQITPEAAQMLSQPLNHYRIDVESDSTVRADLSRRKGEMGEFLNGTAQFFASMAPVVAQAPALAEPVATIYASFARMFNLGKHAEDALEGMAQMMKEQAARIVRQQQQAAQMQQEMAQQEMQMRQQEIAGKQAIEQGKLEVQQGKVLLDGAKTVATV
jgi:hypothetical protein